MKQGVHSSLDQLARDTLPARCINSLFFDFVVADFTVRGRDQPKHVLSIGLRKLTILSQVREPRPESGIGCFSQRYQASRLIVRFHVSWKPKFDGEQKQHDPPQQSRPSIQRESISQTSRSLADFRT
tara:strand:+ start:1001 stop:1381 length:381 start_codon:yes stop_codon:yes gene_type:complete